MSSVTPVPPRIKPGPVACFFGNTNYVDEFAGMSLEPTDSEPLTFGELNRGAGARYVFKGKSGMSTDPASFHTFHRTNLGREIAVAFAPHGNTTATAAQPHVKFSARFTTPPPISQEMAEKNGMLYDWEAEVTTTPEYAASGKLPGA